MLKSFHLFFLFLCLTICASAQTTFSFADPIPIEAGGKLLLNPWAGGLNSAQISKIDLDFDGNEDLAVFDRTANKLFTFLNQGSQYIYAPDYETSFPTLTSWVLFRDFNCDGKKDLFTGNISGIAVYVNISTNGKLKWRPFNKGTPLLTEGFSGTINLKVNLTDLPAIDDVDGDGDLDILNARFVGVGTIEYHQNMSMERAGQCDSLQMVKISQEWGNFEECNCAMFAFDGIDCSQVIGGRVLHDAGKSLLTLDVNNDGARDLLFSEQNCTSLYALLNQGTSANADIGSFETFPVQTPSTLLFPAAYYEDVDFDGIKDLLISSNISASVFSNMDLTNSVWQYKNTGTDLLPQLSLTKSNFLQESMLDVGSYAAPSFADVDKDGDLDLFIGYWSGVDTVSSIYQYENTGTLDQPAFTLVTNDYLQFSKFGLYNIKIQFVDVNADGKIDLSFTASDKQSGVTRLYFLYNQGVGAFDFTNQQPVATSVQLDPSENVLLTDIDKDGLPDMLIGKVDGSLQYWRNAGSANSFFPVLTNSSYLGLGPTITRYSISSSVADLSQDGKSDLLVSNKGSIVIFPDFLTNPAPQADTIYIKNTLQDKYEPKNLGSSTRLATADLYFNFSPLIFVGTITGGIYVLKSEHINAPDPQFFLWPNPVAVTDQFSVRANQPASVLIYNMVGQQMGDTFSLEANTTENVRHNLAAGMYIARVAFASQTVSYKFIVR